MLQKTPLSLERALIAQSSLNPPKRLSWHIVGFFLCFSLSLFPNEKMFAGADDEKRPDSSPKRVQREPSSEPTQPASLLSPPDTYTQPPPPETPLASFTSAAAAAAAASSVATAAAASVEAASAVASAAPTPQRNSSVVTFLDRFNEIRSRPPGPTSPFPQITADDEEREGSTKWVRHFSDEQQTQAHAWHYTRSKAVQALRNEIDRRLHSSPGANLPSTNVAVIRMTFVLTNGKSEEKSIPFFFLSGWPANTNRTAMKQLAQQLEHKDKRLQNKLNLDKPYGLHFVSRSYKGEKETPLSIRDYNDLRIMLLQPIRAELLLYQQTSFSIPGERRLNYHVATLSSKNNTIFGMLYLHSEQAIWPYIRDEVQRFHQHLDREAARSMAVYTGSQERAVIAHVIVDICSLYDLCCCCADTLASCCHTKTLGANVVIRASGINPYSNKITNLVSLRNQRMKFGSYQTGQAFQLPPEEYKPYIAHATVEDLRNGS